MLARLFAPSHPLRAHGLARLAALCVGAIVVVVGAQLAALAQTAAPVAAPAVARTGVGEVTLAIGQSEIGREAPGASVPSVQKGADIREGDVIRTSASGHVHIRFVDGALVSVRPNSVFTIHQYKFDIQRPAESVIRLSLDRGEARSVSGAAAQAARERFRLNTPLVAIGVRGTDFVTETSAQATRVRVNQGAIVMAPLDSGCRAEGLGICQTQRARELTAQISAVLEYKTGGVAPSLQPMPVPRDSEKLQPSDRLIRDSANGAPRVGAESLHPEELAPSRLVWGRWARTPVPGDELTIGFREALVGNDVMVGDGYYFLFRSRGVPNLLPGLDGTVDFKLSAASAYHRSASNELAPAAIDSASLSVDFGRRSYSTQISVSAQGVPTTAAQFAGSIDAQSGIFLGASVPGGRLAGGLSSNGRQAGYHFSVPIGFGSISGATLWSR